MTEPLDNLIIKCRECGSRWSVTMHNGATKQHVMERECPICKEADWELQKETKATVN